MCIQLSCRCMHFVKKIKAATLLGHSLSCFVFYVVAFYVPLPGEASLRSALHTETVKGHARSRSHVPIVSYHVALAYACAAAAAFASLRAFASASCLRHA